MTPVCSHDADCVLGCPQPPPAGQDLSGPQDGLPAEDAAHGQLEGPWDSAFFCLLPFEMRSKSNFRRYSKTSAHSARNGWAGLRTFEEDVAIVVRPAIPATWPDLGGELKLALRPALVCFIFANTTLDAANLAKSVPDALQHLVMFNDASIRHTATLSRRTRRQIGGLVAFAALRPDASLAELVAASAALQQGCLPLLDRA